MTSSPPVLIVPGLNNSGPDHWQSFWFKRLHGAVWVDQIDWDLPRLGDWVASLVQAILEHPGAILVGHSLGCALIDHVAQLREQTAERRFPRRSPARRDATTGNR